MNLDDDYQFDLDADKRIVYEEFERQIKDAEKRFPPLEERRDVPKKRRLGEYLNGGVGENDTAWLKYYYNVSFDALYHEAEEPLVEKILNDLRYDNFVHVDQPTGGTQFKLVAYLQNGGKAMIKPKRTEIHDTEDPNTFYFSEMEKHNSEIAAFYLDRALGFHRVSPAAGRVIDLISDVREC